MAAVGVIAILVFVASLFAIGAGTRAGSIPPPEEWTEAQRLGLEPVPGTFAAAMADLNRALEQFGHVIWESLPMWARRWFAFLVHDAP